MTPAHLPLLLAALELHPRGAPALRPGQRFQAGATGGESSVCVDPLVVDEEDDRELCRGCGGRRRVLGWCVHGEQKRGVNKAPAPEYAAACPTGTDDSAGDGRGAIL